MSTNWLRPRRLVDSYVSYLLGVQPLIEAAVVNSPTTNDDNDEAAEGGDDEDGKAAALRNVMEEIKFQTASAATDKRTSALLELLVQAAGPKAAVVALARCAPYAAFIAHNRHGSHVLQTLLSMVGEQIREKQKKSTGVANAADGESVGWVVDRSATSNKNGGNENDADAEDDDAEWAQEPEAVVVMLWDNLIGLTSTGADPMEEGAAAESPANRKAATEASPREVVQSLVALSCDVCAAHVLRALLCVLSGAPVVQERRGKNARHGQEAGATLAEPSALRTETRAPPPPVLRALWERTVALLAGSSNTDDEDNASGTGGMATCASAVELQHMSCDPSGAATLGLLLQLEATANITQRGADSHQNNSSGWHKNSSGSSGDDADDGPLADWSNQAVFGVLGDLRPASGGRRDKLSPGLRLLLRLLEFDDLNSIVVNGSGGNSSADTSGEASSSSSSEEGASSPPSSSRAADVVYGLAGEAAASHLLETALRVLPNPYFEALVRRCLVGSLHEYVLFSSSQGISSLFFASLSTPLWSVLIYRYMLFCQYVWASPLHFSFRWLDLLCVLFVSGVVSFLCRYAEHGVGNYVVQTLLRVCRSPRLLSECVDDDLLPNIPKIAAAQKFGVLWRLADALSRLSSASSSNRGGASKGHRTGSSMSSGSSGEGVLLSLQVRAASALLEGAAQAPSRNSKSPPESVANSLAGRGVYALLAPVLPGSASSSQERDLGGDEAATSGTGGFSRGGNSNKPRLKLDVPGARTVAALLNLRAPLAASDKTNNNNKSGSAATLLSALNPQAATSAPGTPKDFRKPKEAVLPEAGASVRACVALAVSRLPPNILAALAVDSLGSKCVLQPVLEAGTTGGYCSDSEEFLLVEARRRLICVGLKGYWPTIAVDSVGQHTLRAAFQGSNAAGKERIALELAPVAQSKLLGSSAGRASSQLVGVDSFVRRKSEWLDKVRKADGKNTGKADGKADGKSGAPHSSKGAAAAPSGAIAAALAAAEAGARARLGIKSGAAFTAGGVESKEEPTTEHEVDGTSGENGHPGGKKANKRSQIRMDKVLDIKKRGRIDDASAAGSNAEAAGAPSEDEKSKRPRSEGRNGEVEKPKKKKDKKEREVPK